MAALMPADFIYALRPQALVNPQTIEGIRQAIAARGLPAAAVEQIVNTILAAMKPALASATTEAFLLGGMALGIGVLTTAFIKEIPLRKRNERPGMALAEGVAMPENEEIAEADAADSAVSAEKEVAVAGRR
jgi:hypothetical protein